MKTAELESGDSLIMKCDNFVNNWLANEDGSLTEVIIFQLNPINLGYIYEDEVSRFLQTPNNKSSSLKKIPPSKRLMRFAKEVSSYIDEPELMDEELLKIKTRELIFLLSEMDADNSIKAILADLCNHNDHNFKQIVEANVFENLNLDDIAFMAGLSLSSFQRKFTDLYNNSPRKYINTKRLEKAKEMLNQSDIRINEIAYSCGFQDVAYFSNAFTAAYSQSPSAYRKGLK